MKQRRLWIVAGACLDLAGALLVATSLSQGGVRLLGGIALVLAGSFMVFRGVLRPPQPAASRGGKPIRPDFSKWRSEPELRGPTPRNVQLAPSGRRLAIWGSVVILALGGYVYLFTSQAPPGQEAIEELGVHTKGTVHDKRTLEQANGTAHYLYYNFKDEAGSGVRSSIRVPESVYSTVNVNDTIGVVYLPQDPLIHVVPGISENQKTPPAFLLVAGFLAIPLVMAEIIRRRHRTLVSQGEAVPGVVRELGGRGQVQSFSVYYTLGEEERSLRGSLRGANLREGSLLTVLYLADNPDASLLYASSFYRAV
jgi:hypothetical protein